MGVSKLDIAVIGAGAAGVFAAIHAAQNGANVQIFEASNKALAKVKISGGGRCNICHHVEEVAELIGAYPRLSKAMRKSFYSFGYPETRAWFESRGLELKVEADGRVFPITDDSQSVIDLLMRELQRHQVKLTFGKRLKSISAKEPGFELDFGSEQKHYDRVILAMGGQPKLQGFTPLDNLALKIVPPVPSLFTFNVPQSPLIDLQGLSVPEAQVQIPGTKWKQEGPLLITHWGFSGPAVLKLSAWQARDFAERNYQFPILINWLGLGEADYDHWFSSFQIENAQKRILNARHPHLARRLWERLVELSTVPADKTWADLNKKEKMRLREVLLRSPFEVSGKTTFKEEFVTAGGIDRSEINFQDFSVRAFPGLYAVGELVDVDGITGGYNFQHAWTGGHLAGMAASLE